MEKKGHLAGLLFATIFGFSFMFSKIALAYVTPIGLISYRFLLAFLVFEILRRLKVIKIRFQKQHLKYWLPVVLFQPILYFLFETYGLQKSSSGEAGMMIAMIPIFVSIFSGLFLKEKPKPLQFLFIFMSVAGILFIQFSKQSSGLSFDLIGLVLLLFAVLSAAMFNIASRKASTSLRPYELTYFMMLSGAMTFNIIYVIQLLIQKQLPTYFTLFREINLLLPILYLGVIASIGGFFLVNYALSKLPAHVSSIYSNLSTIVAITAGAVLLKEPLYYYHYIGSILIICGVYGTVRLNQPIKK